MNSFDWTTCCQQLKAGDRTALEALFRCSYAELANYARFWLGHRHEAEDVVQEVFIRLWEHRHTLDPRRSLRALLFVSVRNRALNVRRDRHPATARDAPDWKSLESRAAAPDDPPEIIPLETRLNGWLAELPERRREAFCLSRFQDMRYADIAEVMGISIKTVEQHIGEALRFLRDKIRVYDADLLEKIT